jgi:hypothetical protein
MEGIGSIHDGTFSLEESNPGAGHCCDWLRLASCAARAAGRRWPSAAPLIRDAGSDVARRGLHALHPSTGPFAACRFPFRSGR